MVQVENKLKGIVYAIVFTVVVVSLSVHLTAFVYAYADPQSTAGYILLSTGIAFLIAPVCSYFLASYTVNLINLQNKVTVYVSTDALTGCLNRQSFLTAVETEQLRMHRSRAPAAILLFDLDLFKILNTRYDHSGGDLVLQSVATAIQSDIRSGMDVIARWGGEEFAVMLAETSLEEAVLAGERIRANIEAMVVSHQGDKISTTVSIGITDLHWAECLKQAIDRADTCVIDAKAQGRNLVRTTQAAPKPFRLASAISAH